MPIQDRSTREGMRYRVYFRFKGALVFERWGRDRRDAERLDRKRKKELADGTYRRSPGQSRKATVREFAAEWMPKRAAKIKTAADERRHLELHVLSREWFADKVMDDVEPPDVTQLVEELLALGTLSPKYVVNIYGTLRTMFKHARHGKVVTVDPCVLLKGTIKREKKKPRLPYERADVRALTGPKVDIDRRVFAGLAFYLGGREGELCGLRFSDYEPEADTLGSMRIERQYGGEGDDAETKTETVREVPVHPALADLLDLWWDEGFELVYLRPPTLDDHIVPMRRYAASRHPLRPHHTRSSAYKMWAKACEQAGVENRSLHSTRHTMISWARRGGARKEILEKVTHNAAGDIIDHYTHFDWYPLCEAILALTYEGEDRTLGQRRGPIGRRGRTLGGVDPLPALPPGPAPDDSGAGPGVCMPRSKPAISKVPVSKPIVVEAPGIEPGSDTNDPRQSKAFRAAGGSARTPPIPAAKRGAGANAAAWHREGARLVAFAAEVLRLQAEGPPDVHARLTALAERAHAEGVALVAEGADDEAAS